MTLVYSYAFLYLFLFPSLTEKGVKFVETEVSDWVPSAAEKKRKDLINYLIN
jgi:hypothetical protein